MSALGKLHESVPQSQQMFENSSQRAALPVGEPMRHSSADKQVTGEAVYVDDLLHLQGEVQMALVLSTEAHANIVSVTATEALKLPGVVDYLDHTAIPGTNQIGIMGDEEFFASKKVHCQGQVIGCIVADTKDIAQRAAKLVKVTYERLPSIITIEESMAAGAYLQEPLVGKCGDVVQGISLSDHVFEGTFRIGGQEHFYLETMACLVNPLESGEFEIHSSTQSPSKCQQEVADALGIPAHRVTSRVKRLGGGFGGKECRAELISLPAAVASNKLGRPVRCMLDRDEDMTLTGTRHPFLVEFKVGCSVTGKLIALDLTYYLNCGCSYDLSLNVLERAMMSAQNCYNIPHMRVTGKLCRTNTSSNTAFRGFGGPQAMMAMEVVISKISSQLSLDTAKVQEINFLRNGDETYLGTRVEDFLVKKCWEQCMEKSNYVARKKELNQFNSENRWKKRGLSVVPTMFGISFMTPFLNQGGALVHIYKDGSVLLSHGGVEMGQGLHTKMIQIASGTLKIPAWQVFLSETSTAAVPNTTPTAASASSDLYGMAVKNACEELLRRLSPYITKNPRDGWSQWVLAAYKNRISLSATGFYKVPANIKFSVKRDSQVTLYYTNGAACSEVEVDCLTGDHKVLRTDIVMDIGQSLNPAVDVGQIEGAFVQGYGLFLLEQIKITPDGYRLTQGPGTYKIPSLDNIPAEFNVTILKGASNPKAVYSSKGVGEPPLFLASSIFFAVKNAIASGRADAQESLDFDLDSPATPERIRMACKDTLVDMFPMPDPNSYKPFYVEP